MKTEAARGRFTRAGVLAALFFVAATVLMTWPQAAHPGDRLNDLWDAKQNAWILHWDFVQTFRDPIHLFQAPILHPARYALAFSENLYGAAVFGFPLLAMGVPTVVNYNLVFLLGMAFSAWSAWLLARYVTGDAAASLLAGLVYAFVPWRFTQLPHINMQWGGFLCLLFLFLLRYLDTGRRRDLVLFGACFAGNLLATFHYGLFSGFLVGVALVIEGFAGPPERRRRILPVLAAAAVSTLVCAPFLVPYRMAEKLYGMRRRLEEIESFSAVWTDFLAAGPLNRLYGSLNRRWERVEGDFFPGLVPVGLTVFAILRLRRDGGTVGMASPSKEVSPFRRRAARALDLLALLAAAVAVAAWRAVPPSGHAGRLVVLATVLVGVRLALAFPERLRRLRLDRRAVLFLAVGAVGLVVAFGAHTPYYGFLFRDVGSVFRAIRVPARGIVLFHMALGVLAAWGLSLATRRLAARRRAAWIGGAVLLLTVEYRAFPLDLFEYEASPRSVYGWLRRDESAGAVVEWPLGFPYDCEAMLRQAEHGKPILNGHQSYSPPAYVELVGAMRARPIPSDVWNQLARLEAATVVYHSDWGNPYDRVRYRRFLREGLTAGRLRPVHSFRDRDATSFVFRLGREGSAVDPASAPDPEFRRRLEELQADSDADAAPPTVLLQVPAEGQRVAPGLWGYGWAVDDSGIAEVRVGSEHGPAGIAQLGGKWPGLAETFPDLPGSVHGGFGFPVPELAAGAHVLKITVLAQDGGKTELLRRIVVDPAAARPQP